MAFTRITSDPGKMAGVPCIRGLRFPVATVVAMVADGMTNDEILAEHPDLVDADDGSRRLLDESSAQPLDELELGADRWSIERNEVEQRSEVEELLRLAGEHAAHGHCG